MWNNNAIMPIRYNDNIMTLPWQQYCHVRDIIRLVQVWMEKQETVKEQMLQNSANFGNVAK
jgi:hypothetical protein